MRLRCSLAAFVAILALTCCTSAQPLTQEPNTWVKRSPLADGPPSPSMGYETTLGYDPLAQRVIRWSGHNQGGGGEQNTETWAYDLATGKWELKEPNTSPPGVCCGQQNVFDTVGNRFVRFSSFAGSHGWHWFRENYLSNSTAWNYDLASNTWRDLRPLPTPRVAPLRCAAWDSDHGVIVVFGGEGSYEGTLVYDPHTNTWTKRRPTRQPEFRSGGNMAYDAVHKQHILFGSQFIDDPHTWAYDLRKNEWRDLKPATQPPTDRNDAVLTYDSVNGVIVAVVRAIDRTDGKEIQSGHCETWTFNVGKNTWTKMKPNREPDGWGNRRRVMTFVPDQNVAFLEVYVNPTERVAGVEREQQVWTYRYDQPKTMPPAPPTHLRIATTTDSAALTWKPSSSSHVAGYTIHRGEGATPWQATMTQVGRVGKEHTEFQDAALKRGTIYYYTVRAVDVDGRESEPALGRTQPRIVEDVVVSVAAKDAVQLTWKAMDDAVGYHVERAPVEVFSEDEVLRLKKDTPPLEQPSVGAVRAIGPFERLTDTPLTERTFSDRTVDLLRPVAVKGEPLFSHRFRADQLDAQGKPYRFAVYAYRVRAVNRLGVESGPSPYFLTVPSAVQWVFAKEEGEQCHLKWAPNPERGVQGYRVYRMEGPKINGPGQPVTRLTADAVTDVKFTDPKASKETKRYWVVAVDALGQEGIPSAPVWHYRQYRKFYEPFVGEWHQ